MVVVRFKSEWKGVLKNGFKTQTIRPMKFYSHLGLSDKIHCYITKKRKFKRPVISDKVAEGIVTEILEDIPFWEILRSDIAKKDGFENVEQMKDWFIHQYGDKARHMKYRIIRWEKR